MYSVRENIHFGHTGGKQACSFMHLYHSFLFHCFFTHSVSVFWKYSWSFCTKNVISQNVTEEKFQTLFGGASCLSIPGISGHFHTRVKQHLEGINWHT